MGISNIIKKALNLSCIYFTIITACYLLILQFSNVSGGEAAVEASRVLLFFVASVLFAIAGGIGSIEAISKPVRVIIHYVIFLFAFWSCFILPVNMLPSFAFTGLVLFSIGYAIVMALIYIFKSRLKKNRSETEAYKKQFINK